MPFNVLSYSIPWTAKQCNANGEPLDEAPAEQEG
jgi:hypothetical protein